MNSRDYLRNQQHGSLVACLMDRQRLGVGERGHHVRREALHHRRQQQRALEHQVHREVHEHLSLKDEQQRLLKEFAAGILK